MQSCGSKHLNGRGANHRLVPAIACSGLTPLPPCVYRAQKYSVQYSKVCSVRVFGAHPDLECLDSLPSHFKHIASASSLPPFLFAHLLPNPPPTYHSPELLAHLVQLAPQPSSGAAFPYLELIFPPATRACSNN